MIRPRRRGGWLVALERAVAVADDDSLHASLETWPELWADGVVRNNEGGCDPDGNLYLGSMAYSSTPGAGKLYHIDPAGRSQTVLDAVTISNGIGWSPDGSLAYYIDTRTERIDVFDWSSEHGLTDRRPWASAPGQPDGLASLMAWPLMPMAAYGWRCSAGRRSTATTRTDAWTQSCLSRSGSRRRWRSLGRACGTSSSRRLGWVLQPSPRQAPCLSSATQAYEEHRLTNSRAEHGRRPDPGSTQRCRCGPWNRAVEACPVAPPRSVPSMADFVIANVNVACAAPSENSSSAWTLTLEMSSHSSW